MMETEAVQIKKFQKWMRKDKKKPREKERYKELEYSDKICLLRGGMAIDKLELSKHNQGKSRR